MNDSIFRRYISRSNLFLTILHASPSVGAASLPPYWTTFYWLKKYQILCKNIHGFAMTAHCPIRYISVVSPMRGVTEMRRVFMYNMLRNASVTGDADASEPVVMLTPHPHYYSIVAMEWTKTWVSECITKFEQLQLISLVDWNWNNVS